MKKFFVIVLTFAMTLGLFAVSGFAATINNLQAVADRVGKTATITGVIDSGAGQEVTIRVLKPDNVTESYVGQTTSGVDGGFAFSYSLDGSPDGTYSVDVGGTDVAPIAHTTFVFDTTAPTMASLSSDDADNIVKDADIVVITAVFNEAMAAAPTVNIDYADATPDATMTMTQGIDATTWIYSWDVPAGNTTATVTVAGTDVAGNAYAGGTSLLYEIDNTAPIVTGVTDSQEYNHTVTISFDEGIATLNVAPFADNTDVSAEDTYVLVVTDTAGNITTVNFKIDLTSPAALINTAVVKGGASITTAQSSEVGTVYLAPEATYADKAALEAVVAAVNGTKADVILANTDTTITAPSKEGIYKLYAVDKAGNISDASTNSITVDNTAPTASITYSDADGKVKAGDIVTITATFTEELLDAPIVKIAISGANTMAAETMTKVSKTVYTFNYTVGVGDGAATVALSAGTDEAGNQVTAAPISGATFTVDNTASTATVTTVTVNADGSVASAQSSEAGTVYIVPENAYADKAELDAVVLAGDGTTAVVATNIDAVITAPMISGDYKLYAVDEVGNVSQASIGTITVRKFNLVTKFTNFDGDKIDSLADTHFIYGELDARNNQTDGTNQDMMIITALYRPNGSMESVSFLAKSIDGQDTSQLVAGFNLPPNTTGYIVKSFIWDGTTIKTSSMKPLSNVQSIQ